MNTRLLLLPLVLSVAATLAGFSACGAGGGMGEQESRLKSFEEQALTAEFSIDYALTFSTDDSADEHHATLSASHLNGASRIGLSVPAADGRLSHGSWILTSKGVEIACGVTATQPDGVICRQSTQLPRADRRFLGISEYATDGSAVTRSFAQTIADQPATCFEMTPRDSRASTWTQCFDVDGALLRLTGPVSLLFVQLLLSKLDGFELARPVTGAFVQSPVDLVAIARKTPTVEDFAPDLPVDAFNAHCKPAPDGRARGVSEECARSLTSLPFQLPAKLEGYREHGIDVIKESSGDRIEVVYENSGDQNLVTLEAAALDETATPSSATAILVGSHSVRFAPRDQGRVATWSDGGVRYHLIAKDPAFEVRAIDARLTYIIEHFP